MTSNLGNTTANFGRTSVNDGLETVDAWRERKKAQALRIMATDSALAVDASGEMETQFVFHRGFSASLVFGRVSRPRIDLTDDQIMAWVAEARAAQS